MFPIDFIPRGGRTKVPAGDRGAIMHPLLHSIDPWPHLGDSNYAILSIHSHKHTHYSIWMPGLSPCIYCFTGKTREDGRRPGRSRMNNKQQSWILPSNWWNELKTCAICNLLRQRRTRMAESGASGKELARRRCPAVPACHIFWVQLRFLAGHRLEKLQ